MRHLSYRCGEPRLISLLFSNLLNIRCTTTSNTHSEHALLRVILYFLWNVIVIYKLSNWLRNMLALADQNKSGGFVFPRFAVFTCFFVEFWLVHCAWYIYCVSDVSGLSKSFSNHRWRTWHSLLQCATHVTYNNTNKVSSLVVNHFGLNALRFFPTFLSLFCFPPPLLPLSPPLCLTHLLHLDVISKLEVPHTNTEFVCSKLQGQTRTEEQKMMIIVWQCVFQTRNINKCRQFVSKSSYSVETKW